MRDRTDCVPQPDDIIVRDQFAHDVRTGPYHIIQYGLWRRHAHRHRWYYYPGITRDQLVLHKQWDSDPEPEARMCFHTSVPDPTAPPGLPARASVEVGRARCRAVVPQLGLQVRAFCFFLN